MKKKLEKEQGQMLTIAVTGHSGSGKTTVTKMLKEKMPNTAEVGLDITLIEAAKKFRTEFECIFQVPLDTRDVLTSLRLSMDLNPPSLLRWIQTTAPFLDAELENEIEKIARMVKVNERKILLVDYFGLPTMRFWQSADIRVMVEAISKEQREAKLVERSQKSDYISDFYNPNCGYMREENLREVMCNAQGVDFRLYNHYDQKLEQDVDNICDHIIQRKNKIKEKK